MSKTSSIPVLPQVRVFTSTTNAPKPKQRDPVAFDPGSFIIAIDNCSSKCMTNNLKDLIDKKPCRVPIESIGGSHGTYKGSVRWKWQDDKGKTFTFEIPDVIYLKDLPFRILSPQQWSRTLDEPAECITRDYDIVMKWNNGRNVRTVRLDESTDVGLMQSAPDYHHCSTFMSKVHNLKGMPTRQRYKAATIFVDHFSGLSYVHLQKTLSSVETLEAKRAFEKFAAIYNVTIKHYHADNGRFADNLWLADIARQGQEITFCGVNAHFQNGVTEKRIRDLQEASRMSILDAKTRWPQAITTELWPYALCHYAHMQTPHRSGKHGGRSPLEVFSGAQLWPNIKHFHPFGCPVYVLHRDLASSKSISKWLPRS